MSREGGSRNGYEYGYRFWMDDGIIARYSCFNIREDIKYLFEIRTNFTIKAGDGGGGDDIIDSERFEVGARADEIDIPNLYFLMNWRLRDYWLSTEEIKAFAAEASAFARSADSPPRRRVIPIAVEMDVRTVRQPDESAGDAADRALRSENLFPLSLMYDRNAFVGVEKPPYRDLIPFLRSRFVYPATRMQVNHYFELFMKECGICKRAPTVGSEISELSDFCGHSFHYHCLVQWLLKDTSCPLCAHPILPPQGFAKCEETLRIICKFLFI